MAQQVNPDNLYQKTREDLLLYEDSRTNSLFNGTANFYITRNDQSVWGAFLRALSKELARLEYDYAYDLVGKEPQYLTPPDIKRRWAGPLFLSGAYPSSTQFDLDYRTMLVELLAAYKQGATVAAIQDVIFAYTGIQVVVQELYKQIGNGVYDQSDRNAIRVAVNVGGINPLADITTLNQLQLIVNSLYTAIDLTKPAHVGLEFTTVFGSDENIDAYTEDISYFPYSWSPLPGFPGIEDNLTVIIRLIENPPFNPMLYQAPILDPANLTTTLAPYGRQFAGSLLTISGADWAALPTIEFTVTNIEANGSLATYTFSNASFALHEGMQVTIIGLSNPAFNITGKISDLVPTNPNFTAGTFTMMLAQILAATAVSGNGFVTPTIQSAYVPSSGGNYTVGMAAWAPSTAFFEGQIIMDTNGSTQMVVDTGVESPPTEIGTSGSVAPTFNFALTSSAGLFSSSTTYYGAITGGASDAYAGRAFIITGFSNPANNGTFFCLASENDRIVLNNVVGVPETHIANAAVSAWSLTVNGLTIDGTLTWRMIGFGQVYTPSYQWIMLLQPGDATPPAVLPPTGEIANWDITHPQGLVAPRLKQTWEISGGDVFQGFEEN